MRNDQPLPRAAGCYAPTISLTFSSSISSGQRRAYLEFFRPFKEPPFSALPLFIRSRWIKKPVQLRRSQVESRRSSFLGSRLDWLRYCERLLEKTANGFR